MKSKCECYIDDLGDLEICDYCAELKEKWYNKLLKELQNTTSIIKLREMYIDDLEDNLDFMISKGDFNDSAIYYITNNVERSIYIEEFDNNEKPIFEDRYEPEIEAIHDTLSYEEMFSRMINRIKEESQND